MTSKTISGAAALLIFLGACGGPAKTGLPDVKLPTLASGTAPSIASCPTPKCLTVYVAPWCGYCRAATPMILEMRKFLKANGVSTRIIVGLDSPEPIQRYAQTFGPDTLMDVNKSFEVRGGVPHFFVSDGSGNILKEVAGYPDGARDAAELASYFGLP